LTEFIVTVADPYVLDLLREELKVFPFPTHFLLGAVLEAFVAHRIVTRTTFEAFLQPIFDNFLSFANEISLGPGLPPEPFIDVFCALSGLLEKFDTELFHDLLDELIRDDEQFLNRYAAFLRIRKSRSGIFGILRRDDTAAFSKLADSDVAQEVLGLFNLKARSVKAVAAAVCGARVCLGGARPREATFTQAAIWGNCQWGVRTFSPADVTRYAIAYHRYDFPLQAEGWAASLAVEHRNLTALTKLKSNGTELTTELLHQAISSKIVEMVAYLVSEVAPTREALELAIRSRDARVVLAVLRSGVIDLNLPITEDGTTALHLAALLRLLKVVVVILNVPGIDVDAVDENGETARDVAERIGADEIARLIQSFKESALEMED
jgi:hypothetical protein